MTQATIAGKTNETTTGNPVRERGSRAGCGCKDRALLAPEKGISKGYTGAMFCMGWGNPRFVGGGPVEVFFAL